MTDTNTISEKGYFLIHIGAAILLSWLIPYELNIEYTIYTFAFISVFVLYECYITFAKRRNWFVFLINLVMPFEVLTIMVYKDRNSGLVLILFIIWLLLSGLYIQILIYSGKHHKRKKRISYNQIRWMVHGCRTIFTLTMVVALLSLNLFYQPAEISTEVSLERIDCTIDDCADSLNRLNYSEFRTLTRDEKIEVMEDVCRIEFTKLGINHGFTISIENLPEEILAQYSEKNYTISINEEYIDSESSFELLFCMCHECYHAYQYGVLQGFDPLNQYSDDEIKRVQKEYLEELSHYCSAAIDLEKYRSQQIEIDANYYAEKECNEFIHFLKKQ